MITRRKKRSNLRHLQWTRLTSRKVRVFYRCYFVAILYLSMTSSHGPEDVSIEESNARSRSRHRRRKKSKKTKKARRRRKRGQPTPAPSQTDRPSRRAHERDAERARQPTTARSRRPSINLGQDEGYRSPAHSCFPINITITDTLVVELSVPNTRNSLTP